MLHAGTKQLTLWFLVLYSIDSIARPIRSDGRSLTRYG